MVLTSGTSSPVAHDRHNGIGGNSTSYQHGGVSIPVYAASSAWNTLHTRWLQCMKCPQGSSLPWSIPTPPPPRVQDHSVTVNSFINTTPSPCHSAVLSSSWKDWTGPESRLRWTSSLRNSTRQVDRLAYKSSQVCHPLTTLTPDRTTAIGKMIDAYLQSKAEMDDRAIHLLFAANRWECV